MANITFQIESWSPAIIWKFDSVNDMCGICKNDMLEKCLECQTSLKKTYCYNSKGECGHAFHFHCINNYNESNNKKGMSAICPMCTTPWKYQVTDMDKKETVSSYL